MRAVSIKETRGIYFLKELKEHYGEILPDVHSISISYVKQELRNLRYLFKAEEVLNKLLLKAIWRVENVPKYYYNKRLYQIIDATPMELKKIAEEKSALLTKASQYPMHLYTNNYVINCLWAPLSEKKEEMMCFLELMQSCNFYDASEDDLDILCHQGENISVIFSKKRNFSRYVS